MKKLELMRDDARKILIEVVKKEGDSAWRSRENCQGLLRDYGGNGHGEIEVLSAAVMYGVVNKLKSYVGKEVSDREMQAMVEEYQGKSFYDNEICGWAVESWTIAMGVRIAVRRNGRSGVSFAGEPLGAVTGGLGMKKVVRKCVECGMRYRLDYVRSCEVDFKNDWDFWCEEHRKKVDVEKGGCEDCAKRCVMEKGMVLVEGGSFGGFVVWYKFFKRFLMSMVALEGRVFLGGSLSREKVVAEFWMSQCPVRWLEWKDTRDWALVNGYEIESEGKGKGDAYPVVDVSWYSALKWCNAMSEMDGLNAVYYVAEEIYRRGKEGKGKIEMRSGMNGYRLPTEWEWDFAARGGINSRGYGYSGSNDLDEVGWFSGNAGGEMHEVGRKLVNELGIYDLSGNAWEWCFDLFDTGIFRLFCCAFRAVRQRTNAISFMRTILISGTYRVLKGGSWKDVANRARVSSRGDEDPTASRIDLGFRLVRSSLTKAFPKVLPKGREKVGHHFLLLKKFFESFFEIR